jgi:hypothetical protein
MTLALGLLGYALLIIAAALLHPVAGLAASGAVCLYLAYANQPRRP